MQEKERWKRRANFHEGQTLSFDIVYVQISNLQPFPHQMKCLYGIFFSSKNATFCELTKHVCKMKHFVLLVILIYFVLCTDFTVKQDKDETKIIFSQQDAGKVSSLVHDDVYNNLFMYINQHPDEVSQSASIHTNIAESMDINTEKDAKITIKVKGASKKATQRTQESTQLLEQSASLIRKNQIDEAISSYEAIIKTTPNDALPYLRLAEIYKVRSKYLFTLD